ncbi:hypothetical protein LP421_22320 [Rhizobium sp. RCAM05350]|nr:hypothetical protein LP421_22320 [Rhizobium sp. RCAM05350]
MIPTHCLLDDLYNERWGDPHDPAPANPLPASSWTNGAVRLLTIVPIAGLCLRQRGGGRIPGPSRSRSTAGSGRTAGYRLSLLP